MSTIYRCWNPDTGDEEDSSVLAAAYDAESAAQKFAELYDRRGAEYHYATHGGEVCVRQGDGPVQTFAITGESRPVYHARIIAKAPA